MGLFIFALCALPLFILSNSGKKREKQLTRSLFRLAEEQNARLSDHETGRDFAIGLDQTSRIVFFYKEVEGRETNQIVRLDDVASCNVEILSRNLAPDKGGRKVIERLQLVFTAVDKDKGKVAGNAGESRRLTFWKGKVQAPDILTWRLIFTLVGT